MCRQITDTALNILKSDELIAINQDPLGIPGDLIWKQGANEVSRHREHRATATSSMLPIMSTLI